ncbi:MAG: response regulator [Campylobacteraceae bacterium]|jgi:DNA-binding NtrC family response regulator|nr:response regulator [Campylobacteraceae bacterium]
MSKRDYAILLECSVLYIEDEADLLKHTSVILEDFVKNVYAVQSTKEAYEVIKSKNIDIIVSDILLKNETGIEFLKRLYEEMGIHIPAILTTAFTDTEYLVDAIKLKVENYIIKPINVRELLDSIHDVALPKIQQKEIARSYNIIKTISAVTDSKQVEIIRFIVKNLDEEGILNYSYADIMERIDVSKPTIIKLFRQLSGKGILVKIQNRKYRFYESRLPIPE